MSDACTSVASSQKEPLIGSASVADRFVFVGWPKNQWKSPPADIPELAPLIDWFRTLDSQQGRKTSVRLVNAPIQRNEDSDTVDVWVFPEGRQLQHVPLHNEKTGSYLENQWTAAPVSPCPRTLIVCTHGKHDQCCARYGQAVFKELGKNDLGMSVLESSHLGGHRFAATLLDFAPDQPGRMYGRILSSDVSTLLSYLARNQVWLSRYRGRVDLSPEAQVAEFKALQKGASGPLSISKHKENTFLVEWQNGKTMVLLQPQSFEGLKSCGTSTESWMRWTAAS